MENYSEEKNTKTSDEALNIYGYIRTQQDRYRTQNIRPTPGSLYWYNQWQHIVEIEHNYNSQYITGPKDSLGLPKAFFNINKYRVILEAREFDLDPKDFDLKADNHDDQVKTLFFNRLNRMWMRQNSLGDTLNESAWTYSKYGGVLIKRIKSLNKLSLHVVPWKDVITDQMEIMKGTIIEKHRMSIEELMEMKGKWDNVDNAIKLVRGPQDYGEEGDYNNPSMLLTVYEVHGIFAKSMLYEKGSTEEYCRQVHIVAGPYNYLTDVDDYNIGENGVTLYCAEEDELPYEYGCREKFPGRGLGVGVVEELFEAQRWTNRAINDERKVMEIAGKIMFQTPDRSFPKNLYTGVEIGTVIPYRNGPISLVNNVPTSLPKFTEQINKWGELAERSTFSFSSVTGQSMPSGTPFRLGGYLGAQARSTFKYRAQGFTNMWERIYRRWVIPHLIETMKVKKKLVDNFTADELKILDSDFVKYLTEKRIKESIFQENKEIPDMAEIVEFERLVLAELRKKQSTRTITFPEGYFNDVEWRLEINLDGQNKNKEAWFESIGNFLQIIGQNPNLMQDPKTSILVDELMEQAGISPQRLKGISSLEQNLNAQPDAMPQGQPVPQMGFREQTMEQEGPGSRMAFGQ